MQGSNIINSMLLNHLRCGMNREASACLAGGQEEEEEEMRSPGKAPPRHIPMAPAGPQRSCRDQEGGFCPNPSG